LSIALDRDVALSGRIGSADVASSGGAPVVVALDTGVHPVALEMRLMGSAWRFVPTWNLRNAFRAAALTVDRPGAFDRWLAPVIGFATSALVGVLLVGWTAMLIGDYRDSPLLLAWTASACLPLPRQQADSIDSPCSCCSWHRSYPSRPRTAPGVGQCSWPACRGWSSSLRGR
jgi:hypothetical protein